MLITADAHVTLHYLLHRERGGSDQRNPPNLSVIGFPSLLSSDQLYVLKFPVGNALFEIAYSITLRKKFRCINFVVYLDINLNYL